MTFMKQFWAKIRIKIRERLNPWFAQYRRALAGVSSGKSLTIISNNCWGGHVYRYFGLSYASPTIGLFFYADDYIRFLSNLKHYLALDLKFIPLDKSRYRDDLVSKQILTCPIGVLDDVEIVFLHYHSEKEAAEKWNRRKDRMNPDDVIVKMSEQNHCTPDHLKAFDALPYERKFVFVHKDYGLDSQIVCKEFAKAGEVVNDTDEFKRHINLIALVRGGEFRK